jgi:hypothetical protein
MNVIAPNTTLPPKDQPRVVPPDGFIACHQPNGFDVLIRTSAIEALYTNAEGHAGVIIESGYDWHLIESLDDVVAMIGAAQPVQSTPPPTTTGVRDGKQDREPDLKQRRKQNEDHAWPPPPDDMRDGDLPKDPNHDPKADEWERDRSDADAAKSEN